MKKVATVTFVGFLLLSLAVASMVSAQATTKSLSTNYTVQNLSGTTANIVVSYMKQYNGTTPGGTWPADADKTTFQVNANSSKVIAQYFDATLTNGAGSATVSSDQAIAAIVNQLARGQTPTSGSYTAFDAGSQSFNMPFVFKKLPSSVGLINSQLIIQNVGSSATNVTVSLINGLTGATTYNKVINNLPVGESFYYDQSTETNLPDGWFGSALVTAGAGGSIVAVGNQFTGPNGLLTYPGFAAGHTQWVVPLYLSRLANGFNSVIAIQNVSGAAIPAGGISVVFTPDPTLGGAPFTVTNPSPVNNTSTYIINPRGNAAFPVGSFGAAKITASGNVVAIVNQLKNETPATTGDNALSYNAIPTNLTGTKVVAPLIMSRLANGFSTVFTVANLTSTAGTCNFTYTTDPSLSGFNPTYTSNGVPLPANGSIVHNHRLASSPTNAHNLPATWFGSATVVCTRAAAGVVNQLQSGAAGDPDLSYNAFTVSP